jgi:hypothetical protein
VGPVVEGTTGPGQAADQIRQAGRCGAMVRPSGSSSPVSSNTTTPLHNRLHPCSGWREITTAASWSGSPKVGQVGSWAQAVARGSRDVIVLLVRTGSSA